MAPQAAITHRSRVPLASQDLAALAASAEVLSQPASQLMPLVLLVVMVRSDQVTEVSEAEATAPSVQVNGVHLEGLSHPALGLLGHGHHGGEVTGALQVTGQVSRLIPSYCLLLTISRLDFRYLEQDG
jgi:hypothetical protein